MNRLTTAFSSALPSSALDTSQPPRDSPIIASPSDVGASYTARSSFEPYDRQSIIQSLIYDDPRATHYGTAPDRLYIPRRFDRAERSDSNSRTRRPELLRHISDNALTVTGRSGGATPRNASVSRDRGVRANVGGSKRRERLGAMCKGPEDRYAVGGPQYLRILRVGQTSSGSATPDGHKSSSPRGRGQGQMLSRGPGGASMYEMANLWKGSWAVSKGVNDLDWGVGAYDKKIVTATPSGNFMLFDLNKSKLEKDVSGGHPRPLNCIRLCQTPSYGHLMLTGSTEGIAKLWDMRDCEPVSKKYYKHSAAVTSLAFSPSDPHHFVVGTENGAIKRYDMRMPPRPTGSVWGAHGNKAVTDLKWRGGWDGEWMENGSSGWMASAGADRTVQIWDMSANWERPPTPIHALHTAYPLRKVSWRPSKPTELAIVPLNQASSGGAEGEEGGDEDAHIEIWDVRRHYVAKYALPTSDGSAVDVAWGDLMSLVTAFQSGVVAQLDLRDRSLPLESVPRQVVTWSPQGEVVYGLDRFKAGEIPFDDLKAEYANHWDKVGRRPKSVSDPAFDPLQAVGFIRLPHTDPDEFIYLAQQYQIEGATREDLCQWNGQVAETCGRRDDARIWAFLRTLIEEFAPTPQDNECTFDEEIFSHPIPQIDKVPSPGNTSPRGGHSELTDSDDRSVSVSGSRYRTIPLDRVSPTELDAEPIEELVDGPNPPASGKARRFISFAPPDDRRISEARTSISTIVPHKPATSLTTAPASLSNPTASSTPARAASPARPAQSSRLSRPARVASSEYDYPDPYGITAAGTESMSRSTSSKISTRDPSPDSTRGVIQLNSSRGTKHNSRDKTKDLSNTASSSRRISAEEERRRSSHSSKSAGKNQDKVDRDVSLTPRGRGDKVVLNGTTKNDAKVYKEERCRPLLHWWRACLDEGDVQLASMVLLVGSAVLPFPKKQSERVVHAYIEMLDQARLPNQSAYIRKNAHILSLEIYAQDTGITHISHCERCRKPTGSLEDIGDKGKKMWWCRRCRLAARSCAICRQGVRGLWMGCGRCGHGGHQKCMRMYYLNAPLHSPTPKPSHPPSQASSSGLQRSTSTIPPSQGGVSTSHDSSGFIIPPQRSSGEMQRDADGTPGVDTEGAEEGMEGEVVRGWNVCPGGCGCRCRAVVALKCEAG